MPAINGLGLVISTFRDYGENISRRHNCELATCESMWSRERSDQGAEAGSPVAVWVACAVPFRVHIVILAPDAQQSK